MASKRNGKVGGSIYFEEDNQFFMACIAFISCFRVYDTIQAFKCFYGYEKV